jgi:hypothetical protein
MGMTPGVGQWITPEHRKKLSRSVALLAFIAANFTTYHGRLLSDGPHHSLANADKPRIVSPPSAAPLIAPTAIGVCAIRRTVWALGKA